MIRRMFIGVLLLLVACARPSVPATPTPDRAAEEFAVYAAYIRAAYLNDPAIQRIVIRQQTDFGLGSTENVDAMLENTQESLPGLDQATFDDFKENNRQPAVLEPRFDLNIDTTLMSDDEFQQLFNSANSDGWENFYESYPNAQGILTLSRVGFNPQADQALLYAGNQSGWLAGAGYYILMVKVDGAWTIDNQVMVWIS